MNTPLNTALQSLPHGPEFRFVDGLVELQPGRSGRGVYLVRGDEPFLKGHFPDRPLFPGVLLLEAVAQLAGVVAQSDPDQPRLNDLKLTATRAVKILGSAGPGATLNLAVEITNRLGNLVHASGSVSVDGRVILRGEVTLAGD